MRSTHRRPRLLAPVAAVVLAAGLLGGCGDDAATEADTPAATEASPTSEEAAGAAGAECQAAVTAAAAQQGAGPLEGATATEEAAESPSPGGIDDLPSPDVTGEAGGEFDPTALYPAFEACESVEEFRNAVETSPQALIGAETNQADEFVRMACDEIAEVSGSTLCESAQ